MKNMRIASKLMMAIGMLGMMLIALIAFASYEMSVISDKASEIAFDRMVKVSLADDLSSALATFRAKEGEHVLSTEPAAMDRIAREKAASRATVDARLATLGSIVKNPQAKDMLARIRQAWPRYTELDTQLTAFSVRNDNVKAANLLSGPMQHIFVVMNQAASELSDLQEKMGKDSASESVAIYSRARILMMVAAALAIIGAAAILVLLVKQIARPVSVMTDALGELGKGRLDVAVPTDERRDEVGALATAMRLLRDQLAAAERAKAEQTALIVDSVGEALSRLAGGDLVSRIDAELTGPFAKLKTDFNGAAASLQATLGTIVEAANGINGGSNDIRQASDDLSHRTEQQAASLEETAAAMDEITTAVRLSAERAAKANDAVRNAREEARHSGDVVRGAVEAMGGIERTSNEISEIISVIDGIAFQTNLLALNAGVEAARAGDAGRGFAVVASEVRALAQRSAEAAKDVKARITASSAQVATGVQFVGETGHALERIIGKVEEVDSLVSEIAASAEQQASGLQQINTAVSEMDSVTQQNAAMVEEATAAARSLSEEATGMTQQIARFRTNDAPVAQAAVQRLQSRVAPQAARRIARPAHRTAGNAALADDWSEF